MRNGARRCTTTALANGMVNTAYSQTLANTGGTGACSWQLILGTLPTGLTLNASTGAISGTPAMAVTGTPLTFKATDAGSPAQSAMVNLTLTITAQLTITTTSLSGGTIGASYRDRKSTRLNSSHLGISYAVFCLKE